MIGDNEVYFLTLHALASSIMSLLVVREGLSISPEVYTGLWQQITILSGADGVFAEVKVE